MMTLAYHGLFMVWRLTFAHHASCHDSVNKVFSLTMSALQLREGFLLHRKYDPFTTHTDIFHYVGHVVYRVIPCLLELRLLLDWSVSPTVLKLQHWMFLEDVHHTVYLRYIDISDLAWTSSKKGRQFPFFVRAYQDIVCFAACLLVLFFSFGPNIGMNMVTSWRTRMKYVTMSHFYEAEGTDVRVSSTLLPKLWNALPLLLQDRYGFHSSLQLMMFPRCSAEVWSVAPETRLLLLGQLYAAAKNETVLVIHKEDDIVRKVASAGATRDVYNSQQYIVPWADVVKLRDTLEKVHILHTSRRWREDGEVASFTPTMMYETGDWVPFQQFYSPFVNNSPNTVVVKEKVRTECDVQMTSVGDSYSKTPSVLYWCVRCHSFVNLTGGLTKMTWNGNGVNEIGSGSDAGAAQRRTTPLDGSYQ
ncbi:hypothetical protein TraAM80_02360 [Trypanosoma rangeli]|uniref:Uncharacterized protein n=1 Tax=Trypanosoma rangeli TaxID=5698 RepID=A0A422NU05_TRYRA|nr:uncharacterized protein TraAM80_02360 [Trypanosoma rangeli]RNF08953.1 hypothetical protein TraAM80_02360 [Trypanosoma rangeli]|eukprot:RNF08953.1 hypothetical protein TraAM80_02360 [Trypanosoma rangeli]